MDQAATPRVGICGAGISGLTLAAVLAKSLGPRVRIDVIERSEVDRDQGYGLDLDRHGQEALARAGVYHRYWEISRPHSDSMALFPPRGANPMGIYFRPRLLQRLMPSLLGARPETNRAKLREVLLEALAAAGNNTSVRFETAARDIREVKHGDGSSTAEVLDDAGGVLGEYDLVVDAMGLHSTLRLHRLNDTQEKHFNGTIMIHGMIQDPESVWPPELLKRFGQHGTLALLSKGYPLFFQRYGASPDDKRTCMFYLVQRGSEDSLLQEIGIPKATSRKSGILTEPEHLRRVADWIRKDMAGWFDPLYLQAVGTLDRVTVRGVYMHGEDVTLKEELSMPLICIGDSLRNCGLGGGGILAMRDAIDLSKVLAQQGAFDPTTGRVNMQLIRNLEPEMLERKVAFHESKTERMEVLLKERGEGKDPTLSLADISPDWKWRGAVKLAFWLSKRWYAWDSLLGGAGSDARSPIYPNVKAHISTSHTPSASMNCFGGCFRWKTER